MTTPHSPTLLESDPQSSETPLENNDLGKELLEAARLGDTNRVSNLMSNGAPLTNDWVNNIFDFFYLDNVKFFKILFFPL